MALTDEQRRAIEETMRLWREDAARMQKQQPKPGDRCPNCDGSGIVRFTGPFPAVEGCEDCAGTGRVPVEATAPAALPEERKR